MVLVSTFSSKLNLVQGGLSLRISRKTAIRDCKTIWAEVANGRAKDKHEALKLHPEIVEKHYTCNCPLCAYTEYHSGLPLCDCSRYCPLYSLPNLTNGCHSPKFGYSEHPLEFAQEVMKLKEDNK
jgi:hypothetical protein